MLTPAMIWHCLTTIAQDQGGAICLDDGSFPGIPADVLVELREEGLVKSRFDLNGEIESLVLTQKGRAILRPRTPRHR